MQRRGFGRSLALLVPVALSMATSGCATIVSGTKDRVQLASHPHGAYVEIRDEDDDELVWSGYLPASVELPRKRGYVLEATLEGYEPATAFIDTELNGWFVGNLFFGGIIGAVVDLATGAMWDLDPERITFQLVPIDGEEKAPDDDVEDEEAERYVLLLRGLDEDGELRQLAVPLAR